MSPLLMTITNDPVQLIPLGPLSELVTSSLTPVTDKEALATVLLLWPIPIRIKANGFHLMPVTSMESKVTVGT